MSLFKSRTGAPVTGSESNAFAGNLSHLPDNTQAQAMIKSFTVQEYQGEIFFQIIWKLVDGEFKGAEVKQRITPYDADDNRAQRALNMLYRIFTICGHRTDYEETPTDSDLAEMKGTICAIKAGNDIIQGTERTWIREVWSEGKLETITGETKVVTAKPDAPLKEKVETAFDREAARKSAAPSLADNDIPF